QFLKEYRLRAFRILLVCVPVLTTVMEVLMTPYLLERYRMDIYWLMGLLCFLSFGIVCQTSGGRQKYWGFLFAVCSYITILSAFMFWMIPYDMNYTQMFPEALKQLVGMVTFGFLQL
ncbi:MAG: hypothetical protein K2N78_10945, partial [Oscillospiraceae bacterium]|nr:hypothetical protein [Oscillospiraceae bacterium]